MKTRLSLCCRHYLNFFVSQQPSHVSLALWWQNQNNNVYNFCHRIQGSCKDYVFLIFFHCFRNWGFFLCIGIGMSCYCGAKRGELWSRRLQSVTDNVSFQQLGFQWFQLDTYVGTLAQFHVHLCKFPNDGRLRSDHLFLLDFSSAPPSPIQPRSQNPFLRYEHILAFAADTISTFFNRQGLLRFQSHNDGSFQGTARRWSPINWNGGGGGLELERMRHKSQSRPPGSFIICTALSQPPPLTTGPLPHNNKYFAPPRNRYCLSYPLTKCSTDRFWLSSVIHPLSKFFRPHESWLSAVFWPRFSPETSVTIRPCVPCLQISPVTRQLPPLPH